MWGHPTPHLVASGVELGSDGSKVIVGCGDHDAPTGGVGPPGLDSPLCDVGLIRSVLVVNALVVLGGSGGGVDRVLGQADRKCERSVDPVETTRGEVLG